MKKILLILLLSYISLFARASTGGYNDSYLMEQGFTIELKCKNGILIKVAEGTLNGNNTRVEQPYCQSKSSWNGQCTDKQFPHTCKETK